MLLPALFLASIVFALVGCTRSTDPCPRGYRVSHDQGRCLPTADVDAATSAVDIDAAETVGIDAGEDIGIDAGEDIGIDAGDIGIDAGEDIGIDAEQDANVHPTDAAFVEEDELATDAGSDASFEDATRTSCTTDDLFRWRSLQASGLLMSAVGRCYVYYPVCDDTRCDLAWCLRTAGGMTSCVDCVAAEVRCTTQLCAAECNMSAPDNRCRACACRHGCLSGSSACAVGSHDICADCSGTICADNGLDTALIVTGVGPMLAP